MKEANKVDLSGLVYLITGATSGIGKAAALGLARRDAEVVLLCRSASAGESTLKEIASVTGNRRGRVLMADLSDPSSIRRAAVEFRKTHKGLDGLVNAAGAIFFNRQTTAFGVDQTWAVNYLGHYLLTVEVLDLLQNRPEARVVTVGGNPAFLKRLALDLDDPSPRDPMAAAGQAMAARVVFALTLARRLRGTGMTSVAFHPGMVRSKLGRHSPWIWRLFGGAMNLWARKDCPIAVDLASSPKFEGQTGCFFDGRGRKVAFPQLEEESLGDNLWKLSQQQSGVEIEKP